MIIIVSTDYYYERIVTRIVILCTHTLLNTIGYKGKRKTQL